MNIKSQEEPMIGSNQFVCQCYENNPIISIRKIPFFRNCSSTYLGSQDNSQKKIIKCKYCNSEIEVSKYSNTNISCNGCKEKRRDDSYRIISPRKCEVCGEEFSYDWRKDYKSRRKSELRFCSKSCSRTFSSTSQNFKKLKLDKCISCGKEIFIKNNTSFGISLCEACRIEKQEIEKKNKDSKKETKEKKDKKEKISIKKEKPLKERKPYSLNCKYCNREIRSFNLKRHEKSCDKNPESTHTKHNRKRKDCREGYIYLTENLLNGKRYIGKHVGKPENSEKYLGSGIHLLRALEKYGKENFKKTILEYIEDGDLNEREIYWIEKYDTYNNGYNMTRGGDGNRGMLSGRQWFNNGEINVLRYECPEGFHKGKITKK